jgi:hypothetical protein
MPLVSGMIAELMGLMDFNGKGFLFSENGEASPIGIQGCIGDRIRR